MYGGFYVAGRRQGQPHQAARSCGSSTSCRDEGALGYLEGGAMPARIVALEPKPARSPRTPKANLPPASCSPRSAFLTASPDRGRQRCPCRKLGPDGRRRLSRRRDRSQSIPVEEGRTTRCGPPSARQGPRRRWAWLGLLPVPAVPRPVPAASHLSASSAKSFIDATTAASAGPAISDAITERERGVHRLDQVLGVTAATRCRARHAAGVRRGHGTAAQVAAHHWSPRSAASPPTWAASCWRSRSSRCSAAKVS